jgi:hypothetical protein
MQLYIPVIHITLAGIIAKKSIHHDVLFTLVEPAIFTTEPTLGLAWAWGHENPRKETDDESGNRFEEESTKE